jgi:predicted HTH transcriptional regulator
MPVLLPGDSYSDSISLFNTTDSEAELFFHVDVPEKKDEDVLSHIGLSIHMQEEEIYKGNLISEELHRAISLGKYQPEEQGKLTFTLNVPPDMDNQYALEQAKVKWNFSVQKTDEPAKNAEDSDQTGEHTTSVRTGDSSGIEMYLLLFFGAFVLASLLVVVKRGVKKNENTDS